MKGGKQRKRYRVRTGSKPHLWLHALDPLTPARAASVRAEWRESESEATIFDSNMYADQVAGNAPNFGKWVVELLE